MTVANTCIRCGQVFSTDRPLVGRTVRCRRCGQIQRIPTSTANPATETPGQAPGVYVLSQEVTAPPPAHASVTKSPRFNERPISKHQPRAIRWHWRGLIRAGVGETSRLEAEIVGLIVLSAADLLMTYALLRRGPAFYESNPVAQWFFVRWNIAGMAVFKFSAMGVVVVIGEVVERHRPGWGRGLLLASCAATAVVVFHGLRLLMGHGDNGAPLF